MLPRFDDPGGDTKGKPGAAGVGAIVSKVVKRGIINSSVIHIQGLERRKRALKRSENPLDGQIQPTTT